MPWSRCRQRKKSSLSVEAIDELISFLQTLRSQLASQPAAGRREDVERALVVLTSFLTASGGPMMLASPKGQRPRPSDQGADLGAIRTELETLGLDEIRNRLQDQSRYSTKLLRQLARELGLQLDSRLPRGDLADAILKRGFANPRAYEGLRGEAAQPAEGGTSKPESRK
jgi:hypothetical protein